MYTYTPGPASTVNDCVLKLKSPRVQGALQIERVSSNASVAAQAQGQVSAGWGSGSRCEYVWDILCVYVYRKLGSYLPYACV